MLLPNIMLYAVTNAVVLVDLSASAAQSAQKTWSIYLSESHLNLVTSSNVVYWVIRESLMVRSSHSGFTDFRRFLLSYYYFIEVYFCSLLGIDHRSYLSSGSVAVVQNSL